MKPWYAEGLKFTCTQCGDCCRTHGEYAHVWLYPDDVTRLAEFRKQPRAEFLREFTRKDEDGLRTLNWVDDACIFLSEQGCTVYEARPEQCRTWPFWTENMKRSVWEKDIAPFCPGVGEGRLYQLGEIRKIGRGDAETGAKPATEARPQRR